MFPFVLSTQRRPFHAPYFPQGLLNATDSAKLNYHRLDGTNFFLITGMPRISSLCWGVSQIMMFILVALLQNLHGEKS